MPIVKIKNSNLVVDTAITFLQSDTASGTTSLSVQNIIGFASQQIIIVGALGNQGSEILSINGAPSGTTITTLTATLYAHAAGTPVQVIQYDQVEVSTATTAGGTKSVLSTFGLWADSLSSNYIDNASSLGFYFGRFKNSITSAFSNYSSAIPVSGYGILAARTVIDKALNEIGKVTSEVLSDVFAFQQLDDFQTEVIRELKRWSFLQKFDAIIGNLTTGSWTVPTPADMDDQNTNRSTYEMRIGANQRLTWVDKEKFDEFLVGVAYTTLKNAINVNDVTITLTNAGDFPTPTGTVTIGANNYTYSAINYATGVLTIPASTTTNAVGAYVFSGATQGLPEYWTTYGGTIYYWPTAGSTYNNLNIYSNYYVAQTQITTDVQNLIVNDPTAAKYYLCWKFLKKLNNGEETPASQSYQVLYEARKTKMKNKEVLGTTFKFRPRINNFSVQEGFNDSTPRSTKLAKFPNTGF